MPVQRFGLLTNSDRNDLPTFRSSGAVIEAGEIVYAKTAQNRKKDQAWRHGCGPMALSAIEPDS